MSGIIETNKTDNTNKTDKNKTDKTDKEKEKEKTCKIYKMYRIKFEKTGVAKYISHLDLNRLFSRSLARAGIDVMHSEGFNPRPKISFVSALSLGVESLCEFVEIKISDINNIDDINDINDMNDIDILEKIKRVFPQGVNITDVYEPVNDFKNIDRTRYHIYMTSDDFCAGDLKQLFANDVIVEKKPGVNINLKDYICDLTVSEGLADVVLKSNQEMFLNPENIIKGINLKYMIEDYSIKKIEVYDKNNEVFR